MQSVDTVIEARWLVPVRPRAAVLEHHGVAVDQGRIRAVLPIAQLRQQFTGSRRFVLDHHALIPGLVNAHGHCATSLLRGAGDDLPPDRWLHDLVRPLERALVSAQFVFDGARLAGAQMLRAGVTTCNDAYFHPGQTAQGLRSVGMRAVVGIVTAEHPSRYASDADDYLRQGLAARDALKDDPLVGFTLAPDAPHAVTDRTLERIATLAEELDLPVHIAVHETAAEIARSVAQLGCRPLERLDRLGLVNERLIAVHMTQLLPAEIELVARRGAAVAHCPTANLKRGSGIAPIAELLRAGVRVGIGTDGAAGNNRLDLLGEARLAALLAKGRSADPTVMPAAQALECATLAGAQALGLEERIGSIEAGKEADLAALDLSAIEVQGGQDPLSQILYSAGREHVTHVWVAGASVVDARVLGNPGLCEEIMRAAAPWHNQVRQKLRQSAVSGPIANPPTMSPHEKG
jgi:5-methylthioadenosine/S-adenosylhomocysteine deaminase